MSIIEILFLSVALAMDCFTVSIASGMILKKWWWQTILRIAFLFGLFQALMPLLGWLGTHYFSKYIQDYDHWIAFALLAYLGSNMIKEAFSKEEEEEKHFNPAKTKTQFTLAIATSIDALAIGISFSCLGYNSLTMLTFPLIAIGITSFLFSLMGHYLGITLGKLITQKLKPELLGGVILLIIGGKILFEHLFE